MYCVISGKEHKTGDEEGRRKVGGEALTLKNEQGRK
jgi:hypothetical protein